ncbi:MAG: hypothetical protein CVU63_04355 [Deltaproteobacteria bacterium HGW-Deltaproteobacteria-20]|jgi:radical SAM protein with 4Fe4S-binding SPASM domain|nr:MAG: hypothetical protein CVU63_04355 [Deltaproteobacteria bacterium HGW-Deltaproteobacteria-20]
MSHSFPPVIEWEITRACNLSCAHCYNRPGRARTGELDTDRAIDVARQIASLGGRSVTLSGGEPTLRADLFSIARTLTDQGVGVQLATNGQTLTQEVARAIQRAHIRLVLLSVDGTEEVHDTVRRKRGAFAAVRRAVDALSEAGVPFAFTTVLLRPNLPVIEALGAWVASTEAVFWSLWRGIPTDRSSLWLRSVDLARLPSLLERARQIVPALVPGDNVRPLLGAGPSAHTCGHRGGADDDCPAGVRAMGLRSDGTAVGCLALRDSAVEGPAPLATLDCLWSRVRQERGARLRSVRAACRGCARTDACRGGCHATTLALPDIAPTCHQSARRVHPPTWHETSVAASLLVLPAVCGCGTQAQPVPPSPSPAVVVVQHPAEETSAVGASVASPSVLEDEPDADVPDAEEEVIPAPANDRRGNANTADPFPSCCMMHVLRPDCQCGSPPPGRPPKP